MASGDEGIGTIVGSAVFNLCVIVGLSSLCAKQVQLSATHSCAVYPTLDGALDGLVVLQFLWRQTSALLPSSRTSSDAGPVLGTSYPQLLQTPTLVLNVVIRGNMAEWIHENKPTATPHTRCVSSAALLHTP